MSRGSDYLTTLDAATLWCALESAAEEARIGIWISIVEGHEPRTLYVNECAARILGRRVEELLGPTLWSMMGDRDRSIVRTSIERPDGAPPTALEIVIEHPDGTKVPIALAATRIKTAAGVLSVGYFRDVTHEREATEALRRSEARFRSLVDAAPDGVVILQRGVIVFINPKAANLLGVASPDAALGQPIASYLPPADAAVASARILAMLRQGIELPPSEYSVLADPARVVEIKSVICEWHGEPAVLGFARNVTERKAIERRLVESDRLAALGTLAAGVAHEINNPLTYAQLSAQRALRLLDRLDLPTDARAALETHLDDIQHGIRRVASITHSLRSFVTRNDDPPGPVDITAVLGRALKMVENELRHVARLVQDIAPVPRVIGNASQLEQVFVNLLINAIKALSAKPPATRHEIGVSLAHAGDRVTVTISDTGCGIPGALRSRIFDPFFTTRAIGHGMGLGLSVSKTIVEKAGGEIEVDSTEEVGTTVRVHLRAHSALAVVAPPDAPVPPVRGSAPRLPSPHPRMRILVIDDESTICSVLQRILGEHHDVSVATSGSEALTLLASQPFDVVLCDVMMPGMNADELYRRIASEKPDIAKRIAFMSGGALDESVETVLDALGSPRLAKPFRVDEVLALVSSFAR